MTLSYTKNIFCIAIAFLLLTCAFFCLVPENASAATPVYRIGSLEIDNGAKLSKTTLYVGDKLDLDVYKKGGPTITSVDEETEEEVTSPKQPPALRVTWSSTAKSVAKVSSDGVVKAKGPGLVTITALIGIVPLTCEILVLNPEDTKVEKQSGVTKYNAKRGNEIVKAAYYWIGKGKYQAGACRKGYFDCSGFCSYVIAGKRIGNTYSFLGYKHVKNPQPGDICVRSSHAGIYIGSGQMIHAVGTGKGVKMSPVEKGMVYVRIYK